jgi:transposase
MLYIGLDVHCKWITVAGFDPATGELVERDRVPNDPESLSILFAELQGPLHGIMESGINSWAIYRDLKPLFETLTVAEPSRLWDRRRDRKAKTDRADAMRMAQMLHRGEVEGLYIPDEKTQDLRVLVRGKVRISRWVTRLTNEIGSLLKSWGYVGHRRLLTKGGRLDLNQAQLPEHSARVMQLWRELLEKAEEIEHELQAAIEEEARGDTDCELLQTIPGVGPFTALLLKAEIGDVRRFKRSSQLISYVGLAPRVFQSGESCFYGGLGKWGNRWMRYAIGLLAQRVAHSKQDNALRTTYWRVGFKNHTNAAKMAVARKAVRVIHQMLTLGQAWDDSKAAPRKKAA